MVFQQVELHTHRTPFGIRCTDNATQQTIRDGLRLSVLSSANPGTVVMGAVTPSGNFGFGRLGIRLPLDLTKPEEDLRDWEYDLSVDFRSLVVNGNPLADKREFALFCEETQSRFLSCALNVTVDKTNVGTLRSLLLFSAPARSPIPGLTVIRGQVKQTVGPAHLPAPYVRIEANYQQNPAPLPTLGISDERGVFALFLAPPAPNQFTSGAGTKYAETTANAILKVGFEPSKQKYLCVAPDNRMESLSGDKTAELAIKREAGWRCLPDQVSLLSQNSVLSKTVAVALVGETRLTITDNADLKDSSVWLS